MGRAAFVLGTPECRAGVVDGLSGGLLCTADGSSGDSALGSPRTGPILPGLAQPSRETPSDDKPQTEQELNQIWLELSASDRQRFGHCFSFMVLKALGLCPRRTQEVQA